MKISLENMWPVAGSMEYFKCQ